MLWSWGQGAHNIHAVDLNGDGRDEILIGSAALNNNGTLLWSTGLGHPDSVYVGHIDPSLPGLQVYYNMETNNLRNGMCLVERPQREDPLGLRPADEPHPQPGHVLADRSQPARLPVLRRRARLPGQAMAPRLQGKRHFHRRTWAAWRSAPAYWDADPHRALVRGTEIAKYRGRTLPPRVEGSVIAVANVQGDWREEIITTLPGELRIYSTTIPAVDRRACLMQDPLYRMDVVAASPGLLPRADDQLRPGLDAGPGGGAAKGKTATGGRQAALPAGVSVRRDR